MRGPLHDLLYSVLYSSLTVPFPRGLLGALHGCQLRSTKWCARLLWRHQKLRETAKAGRRLPFQRRGRKELPHTSPLCSHLPESPSLGSSAACHAPISFATSSRDATVKPRTRALDRGIISYVSAQTSSLCKAPAVGTAAVSYVTLCITENYRVEHDHRGQQGSRLLGCSSPASLTVLGWQLARSHCTLSLVYG